MVKQPDYFQCRHFFCVYALAIQDLPALGKRKTARVSRYALNRGPKPQTLSGMLRHREAGISPIRLRKEDQALPRRSARPGALKRFRSVGVNILAAAHVAVYKYAHGLTMAVSQHDSLKACMVLGVARGPTVDNHNHPCTRTRTNVHVRTWLSFESTIPTRSLIYQVPC